MPSINSFSNNTGRETPIETNQKGNISTGTLCKWQEKPLAKARQPPSKYLQRDHLFGHIPMAGKGDRTAAATIASLSREKRQLPGNLVMVTNRFSLFLNGASIGVVLINLLSNNPSVPK
ncbi:hypothetical protein KIL84_009815 [Mauremys mutica]|uniref:Uncharacterized protein n=1 Tax=Mauremys mutica TaxID=74926 RepID=A0A9D3XM97_9SAUR|nr:hypothetical protein KIL84_009815 [Mauremys mutica]